MSHTPTPWHAAPKGATTWAQRIGIYTADGALVAELPRIVLTAERKQADAAFICRAVNAHADLVAALEAMTEYYVSLVNSGDAGNWDPEGDAPVIQARAALAKAKGQS